MVLRYSTVQEFWKFMGINNSILDYQPGNVTDGAITNLKEMVKSSPVSAGTYYLKQKGINEDTLVLYAGDTALTITTDYTFDSDTGAVTITSTGATALIGEGLEAVYEYCNFGKDLTYNETERLLQQAENRLHREVGNVFADQSSSTPAYTKIVGEGKKGGGTRYVHYNTNYYPLIKLQTTVNGNYTTGGTEITLTNASGFPTSGTIYIGGNKVAYTSRSSNVLTIPSTTPSIDDGSVVRGEVVEVSTVGSGSAKSFIVLTPDTDYSIDYETGEVQLEDTYYHTADNTVINTDGYNSPKYGGEDRVRLTYMTAWREPGQDAEVPEQITELVYSMAGVQLLNRTLLKANTGQRDNFSPGMNQQLKDYVENELYQYRLVNSRRV